MANEALDFTVNKLILGDNLEILKKFPDECIDLIYLDPPFFSNRNYEVIWGDEGEIRSFQDRWAGGMDHYIRWLYERVEQMHRILKSTGSIYLHCDWHANAYIRVNILDKLFGLDNFRGEIVWQKIRASKKQSNSFGNVHDTIFFYSKTKEHTYHSQFTQLDPRRLETHYNNIEFETGRNYMLDNFTQAGQGTAKKFGDKILEPPAGKHWIWTQEKIDEGLKNGVIVFTSNGTPRVKRYYDTSKGNHVGDIWTDITPVNSQAKERIGYPTQKPEALLDRIIKASSNKGDVVLDPFMGGGTTIAVSDKLGRQWIGIDQSVQAVKVTEFRLEKQYGALEGQAALFTAPYMLRLHKYDRDELFNQDPFQFETWIIGQFGGVPQNKKGGDKGVDGKTKDGTPIQVKQSNNIGVNVVKNFSVSAKQYNKTLFEKNVSEKNPAGYIIAFSFGRGAVEEAAQLKNSENILIELVKVEKIVPLSVKPTVAVHTNELEKNDDGSRKIEFIAAGNSLSGIEFYSWDFEYNIEKNKFKPRVLLDRAGRQIVTLKIGTHNIAVKVVDNDGLENIEIIKLKINGGINRE